MPPDVTSQSDGLTGDGMGEREPARSIQTVKAYHAPSVFRPENLLREARRQRGLPDVAVPAVCVLDPDGDIVRSRRASGRSQRAAGWACYHTEMDVTEHAGIRLGIVGLTVGAPFAVLVAEQLFVSGCRLLISVTSAGQIVPVGPTPYFVLIDRALRDEGTSHHYLPHSTFAEANGALVDRAWPALAAQRVPVHRGLAWTTDAPYRETEDAIAAAREHGALAVEMEAAALYAFANARRCDVLCFAHVTNRMAVDEGDFEKGEADGASDSLDVIAAAARACGFA
jgi:uridine phosphorylase